QFPLGIINVFPTPNIANTLYWDSYLPLSTMASLDASFSLPSGYEDLIQHNLAVRLGPFYKNSVVSSDVKKIAADAMRLIKRVNRRTPKANFEKEIVSRANPSYNIYRDRAGG